VADPALTYWPLVFLHVPPAEAEAAERAIAEGIRRGRHGAYLFWAMIGATAYLGIAKPF
jgi:hypothetical protein